VEGVPADEVVIGGAEAPLAEETVAASAGTASGTSAEPIAAEAPASGTSAEPSAEGEAGPEPESEEDVSLESILEDLKRREGRSE
jgi:hypothetical protein